MHRARTAATMVEALRRLGAFRRKRTIVLGDAVYRVRRDRLVRIPDEFVTDRYAGQHRKCWGRGASGRMDWERQRRFLPLQAQRPRKWRRRFSPYTKAMELARRKRLDRWNLRAVMSEWLYVWELSFFDYEDEDDWDDRDDEREWTDPGWSVTLLDLMR